MKKILVIGMTSTPGGVESFLINYCLNKKMTDYYFINHSASSASTASAGLRFLPALPEQ